MLGISLTTATETKLCSQGTVLYAQAEPKQQTLRTDTVPLAVKEGFFYAIFAPSPDTACVGYLFGDVHDNCEDWLAKHPNIMELAKSCQVLVTEKEWPQKRYDRQPLPDTFPLLSSLISPSVYKLVERDFQKCFGVPIHYAAHWHPLSIAESIKEYKLGSVLHVQKRGVGLPIQSALVKNYVTTAKPIISLEDGKIVYDFMCSFSIETQVAALEYYVTHTAQQLYDSLYFAGTIGYENQDLECFCREGRFDTYSVPTYREMVGGRNMMWIDPIIKSLKTNKSFVVMGCGHLCGPEGMLLLLRQRGYRLVALPY